MNKRKKAFTLIELLVVIAIIALLLSVMMPALQKAKLMSRRVFCMNSMKQQALAFFTHAMDSNGKFPRHNSHLAYYMTYPTETDAGNPWTALRGTYITDSKILICPFLAPQGDMFGSTEFLTPDGIYGGWDTPTATYIRISYNWYANHNPPNSGDLAFNHGARSWPETMDSGGSSHTIITHTVFQIPGGFYDYSHGGEGVAAGPGNLVTSRIQDNPCGNADGSVIVRKKAKMRPKATFTGAYGYLEYYY